MQRKDYTLAELLEASDVTEEIKQTRQMSMFANEEGEVEPTFLKQYIAHYRHICEDDTRWRETYRHLSVATDEN